MRGHLLALPPARGLSASACMAYRGAAAPLLAHGAAGGALARAVPVLRAGVAVRSVSGGRFFCAPRSPRSAVLFDRLCALLGPHCPFGHYRNGGTWAFFHIVRRPYRRPI